LNGKVGVPGSDQGEPPTPSRFQALLAAGSMQQGHLDWLLRRRLRLSAEYETTGCIVNALCLNGIQGKQPATVTKLLTSLNASKPINVDRSSEQI
jgi:hypothetical protein